MGCMKCGRDVSAKQVFCEDCLQVMAQYPVKKDAVVQIPNRAAAFVDRPASVREAPSAATIRRQRGIIRVLAVAVIALAVLLAVTAGMLLHLLQTSAGDPVIPHKGITVTQQTATTQNPT